MASKGELDSVSGRKIPKNLVSKDFWRNYSLKDLITAFLPALVFTFITSQGEERFKFVGFSLSSLFFFLGLFALYICPRHLSMYEWVFKRLIHFISFPSKIRNVEKDEFSSRKGFTDSSRAKFFETDLRTQDLVRIKRFYPLYNCVEKRNGSLVGGIKVEPANMTYKPPEKWRKNVNRLTDILNNYMDSDIQIFCSKRQIPVESQLNLLEKRFLEKDVSRNEVLRSLIEEQLERYPEKAFSTNIQEFYVLVTVSEKEMGKIGGKNWGFFFKD